MMTTPADRTIEKDSVNTPRDHERTTYEVTGASGIWAEIMRTADKDD